MCLALTAFQGRQSGKEKKSGYFGSEKREREREKTFLTHTRNHESVMMNVFVSIFLAMAETNVSIFSDVT